MPHAESHKPFVSVPADGGPPGCGITLRSPRGTDNYALLNYFLDLFESRGGLGHFQTIKVNDVGKQCCHARGDGAEHHHIFTSAREPAVPPQFINASAGPSFDSAI